MDLHEISSLIFSEKNESIYECRLLRSWLALSGLDFLKENENTFRKVRFLHSFSVRGQLSKNWLLSEIICLEREANSMSQKNVLIALTNRGIYGSIYPYILKAGSWSFECIIILLSLF